MPLVALAGVVVAVALYRSHAARRDERAVAARLALGADGVVSGAATIDLPHEGRRAVLLLHGFGDTPQTLAYLASHLHAHGWAVRAPLLPGHGRTLREFAAARADAWVDFAREELRALQQRYESVALIGLSMGGSLATVVAAETPELPALVLLAPYLAMPPRLQRVAAAHWALSGVVTYFRGRGERSIRDPAEAAKSLAYGFVTPRLLHELSKVVGRARAAAPCVAVPTLVVQSRQDNRIPPDEAERAFALFAAADRHLEWTEGNSHIITVDYGRERVFTLVSAWLASHSSAPRSPAPTLGAPHTAHPRSSR